MTMELDPRLTFESFVVGPANRLAAAAARRAAESPGRSYNPLFLYSASGLGKSHILSAIAHLALRRHPDDAVVYQPLEVYLGELTRALERGEGQGLEGRYGSLRALLLDDVQFLTGQSQAQEMLLRTMDAITSQGGQVVLASDRPPAEIDGLDARLMSRFSGGLIVDIGQPDLETRVAIVRRKAEGRGVVLADGVAEALARFPFRNVRELQGSLNRVLAVQELEGRPVEASQLSAIVGVLPGGRDGGDAPKDAQELTGWKREVRRVADAAEEEGFSARRLERLLASDEEGQDWEAEVRRFRKDLERAREIRSELDALGNPWPEAAATLLRDPDRLEESEALLASARERARPFVEVPEGPRLEAFRGHVPALAVRAAARLLGAERPDYNPLFVHAPTSERGRRFLEAAGRTYLEENPEARVGVISVPEFAEEFIRAISEGVAGAWRERWWTVEVLLLHGLEELAETERAQEEFFHLFEALKRREARILLAADRPPAAIENVDDRLRSRFEGGLVVELEGDTLPEEAARPPESPTAPAAEPEGKAAGPPPAASPRTPSDEPASSTGSDAPAAPAAPRNDLEALRELVGAGRSFGAAEPEADSAGSDEGRPWRPSPERVVWDWPSVDDRIVEGS